MLLKRRWDLFCTRMQENASSKVLFIENLSLSLSSLSDRVRDSLAKLFQAHKYTYFTFNATVKLKCKQKISFFFLSLSSFIELEYDLNRRVFFFFSKIFNVRNQIRFRKSNITANSGWGKIYGWRRVSVCKSESEKESGGESGSCNICDTNMLQVSLNV